MRKWVWLILFLWGFSMQPAFVGKASPETASVRSNDVLTVPNGDEGSGDGGGDEGGGG